MGALAASTAMGGRAAAETRCPAPLPPEFQSRPLEPLPAAWLRSPDDQATAAIAATVPASQSPSSPAARYDIPPGPLQRVLDDFEAATGYRVTLDDPSLATLPSPGVTGVFTPERALEELLEGTGLAARLVGERHAAIGLRGVAESVEVRARATRPSSPKYTEPLRDVPQTITVVSAQVIEQQGATTLRDVLRNVTGITFQAGEGGVPAGDQLTIRGFSARTDMYIDGLRDVGGYSRDPFNLESVEVTKGPSSVVAGRGSTGGSINQVTKTPSLQQAYSATIGAGNADYRRTSIDLNQPLAEAGLENAAVRLNAMWTDTGVPGRDRVEGERWGIAPSLAFGLGTPTRVTASYTHLSQDNVPDYGLPWVPANTNPGLQAYSNSRPPVDQGNFYGLTTRDYEDIRTDTATLQIDHDFGPRLSLRSTTRYGRTYRDSVITAPRFASVNTSTTINRQLQSRDMTDRIAAHTTTLTARLGTGTLRHALVAGVDLSREGSINYLRTGPTAPQTDLFAPNPADPYPGPIVRTGASNEGEATGAAVYAFDTLSIGSRWEVTGGLRVDRFDAQYTQTDAAGAITERSRVDDEVSWRAGVVYKPRPTASVYAAAGTSFNPSAEGLTLTAATEALEPERTRSYEVGTKWDVLNERLSLTSAVFRTEKTNARTPGVNPGDPPTVLAGRQIVEGIEAGISGRLSSRATLFAGYALMRGEIAASNTPTEVDNALALTPEQTFNVWATYEFPWRVTAGGGVQYMDSVFRNATNTAQVPSYWLVNALVSYEVNRHLTLRLNANNLTDEVYVDRVSGGHYIPGARRSIAISTGITF